MENDHQKVLLIAHDPEDIHLIQAMLAEAGGSNFELECADGFLTGLERLAGGGIGAVLLDLDSNPYGGLDTLARVRAQAPEVPILVLTHDGCSELAMQAMRRGAQDYLAKEQLNRDILVSSVRNAMERQRLLVQLEQRAAQIQASEDRLRAIINKNADGIIVVDQKGIVRFANPAAESIFGHQAKDLKGELLGCPVGADGVMELDILHRDGTTGIVEVHMVDMEWKGENAYLATIRDVTYNKRLEGKLKQSFDKLQRLLEETVEAMASAVEMRDPYMAGHQKRVAKLACAIAQELGLSQKVVGGLRLAALIHDIGKIYVPSQILTKPGKLTDAEFGLIKVHPQMGYDILKSIEFSWPVAQMVLQHHEILDGSGYPQGLSEIDILPEARIIAVADVVDAMSSERPYRLVPGAEKALEVLSQCRGAQYDPQVVDACVRLFKEKGFKFK